MQGSKSCVGLVVLKTRGPLTVYRELRVARYRNSFQSAREVQPNFNPTKEVDMADNQGGGSNRGTAAMDEEQRREIASKGGQNVPAEERSFSKDRELAGDSQRRRRPRASRAPRGGADQCNGGAPGPVAARPVLPAPGAAAASRGTVLVFRTRVPDSGDRLPTGAAPQMLAVSLSKSSDQVPR